MGKTTSAERMRKLRNKVKNIPEDFTIHLQRERERDKKRRENQRQKEKLSKTLLNEKRRKEADRKRKYRDNLKRAQSLNFNREENSRHPSLGTYACVQTLGKAVNKVKRTLPSSPSKKLAVIRKLIFVNFENAKSLFNEPEKKLTSKHSLYVENKETVISFYQRDDISRQTPGIKDVKSVKNIGTGRKTLYQKRYMNMTVREAYSLFIAENPTLNIKISKFYEPRPPYVLLTSQMPHNVCVCKYHANFNYLVESIANKIPGFPTSGSDLLEKCSCDVNNGACMLGDCKTCVNDIHRLLHDTDLYQLCCWKKWIETEGRPNVVTVEGTIEEAIKELNQQLSRFKTHVYVKRIQYDVFIEAKRNVPTDEAVLQIDFAENYTAISQDEIQSAH